MEADKSRQDGRPRDSEAMTLEDVYLFFHPRHPENDGLISDNILAETLVANISSPRLCRILDGRFESEEVRYAAYDAFMQIVVFAEKYRGVRCIMNDRMYEHLPKRNPRCLFGGNSPREDIKKWPVFCHNAFNAYLAMSENFDYRRTLDRLWEEKFDNLAIWLLGCADAHFINDCSD